MHFRGWVQHDILPGFPAADADQAIVVLRAHEELVLNREVLLQPIPLRLADLFERLSLQRFTMGVPDGLDASYLQFSGVAITETPPAHQWHNDAILARPARTVNPKLT